ncbi:acyl-CoA dehydrogenase family protein [Lysinibacillus sp. NPDC059133]|uniref:acyl-CoA dehydrogenase family protein n=1 Tax=Lysinibacillus sp. NPDC059133 TaxID=3346737 RepID=UPI0036CC5E31
MSDVYIRNDREKKLVQYAYELAQQIDKTASKYDESGEFPFEHFKILEDAGYFKLTVPKKYGGERGKGNIFRGSLPGTIAKKVPRGYIITGEDDVVVLQLAKSLLVDVKQGAFQL